MSVVANAGGDASDASEDVGDFLRRVRELGDKREKEDAERTRNLDEEVAEGRRQREARRAERARSLSPEKQSPVGTPRSMRSPRNATSLKPLSDVSTSIAEVSSPLVAQDLAPAMLEKVSTPPDGEATYTRLNPLAAFTESSNQPSSPLEEKVASPASPRRAGTLSWQQRPTGLKNKGSSPSLQEPQTSSTGDDNGLQTEAAEQPSRAAIAKSLSSKDPAWFRQTADRGVGSAAYRKSNDGGAVESGFASNKRRLHGLSREPEAATLIIVPTVDTSAPPKGSSRAVEERQSVPSEPGPDTRSSAMPTYDSQVLVAPKNVASDANDMPDAHAKTPSPKARMSPERPVRSPSPTKGMGGFVQSAMLSRSNSVTKRWSATSNPQFSRQGPDRGAQSPLSAVPASSSMPKLGEISGNLDSSHAKSATQSISAKWPTATSRDTLALGGETEPEPKAELSSYSSTGLRTPPEPVETDLGKQYEYATPPSPSKRWSPTKSSWLESALSKPESPKPKPAPPKSSQPAWLTELNKTRQQHSKFDSTNNASLKNAPGESNVDDQSAKVDPVKAPSPKTSLKTPPLKPKPLKFSEESDLTASQSEAADNQGYGTQDTGTTTANPVKSALSKKPPGSTPPKPDFRAGLKSRQDAVEQKQGENPEFLNAFGNLRRTKTEKYKAPDEFKDNILRGKAGLAVTGGPQKSVRRDEFKESLINQKSAMKAKAEEEGSAHNRNKSSLDIPQPAEPEALAKRRALGQNDSSGNIQGFPAAATSPTSFMKNSTHNTEKRGTASALTRTSEVPETSLKSTSTSSKLADRFNPGLAGILAKGRAGPGVGTQSISASEQPAQKPTTVPADGVENATSTGQLQHMTKARARGPKRRLPKSSAVVDATEQEASVSATNIAENITSPPSPILEWPHSSSITPAKPTGPKPRTPSTSIAPSKPTAPPKSPALSESGRQTQKDVAENNTATPPRPSSSSTVKPSAVSKSSTTTLGSANSNIIDPTIPSINVRSARAQWGLKSTTVEADSLKQKTPIKLPIKETEDSSVTSAALSNSHTQVKSPKVVGLGVALPSLAASNSQLDPSISPTPGIQEKNPATGITARVATSKPLTNSPIPQTSEAGQLFADFFDEVPVASQKLEIDTQAILSSSPEQAQKVKTLRKQISEITGDGKIVSVPSHQEHMLFSQNMYLCTHTYTDSKGSDVTETYLWVGADVAASTLEDVQLFARKAAREAGGPLVTIRQGKEPAVFFQALGGIAITRKGTSKDALSSFLLCGRQHLGHVTFDEVEFSLSPFCSAFPFIISSSQLPKLFLWKGKGCSAEELGCARLISMDLGSSGEVVEIDEGHETNDFLSIFSAASDKAMPRSADHWKLKKNHGNYKARLFLLDEEENGTGMVSQATAMWHLIRRPSMPDQTQAKVAEIAPFCQNDLEPNKIYVLDTFFEIYVLIGSRAQSKSRAFSSALLFAQDYGILAASSEDRPFVPISTVVLEGAPRDMRAVFRKWDDSLVRTGSLVSNRDGKIKTEGTGRRGRGLKVVPLSAAIAAIRNAQ